VAGLRSIPSLPQVHQSLLRKLEDDPTANAAVARLVADDPGLSLKVLHLANSPLFGRGRAATNPVDAVMSLGMDVIAAIVLSQSIFQQYESYESPEMDLQQVWKHSWETARLAQHICGDKGLPLKTGEEAFMGGLMHEIGRFLLVDNFPDQFKAACDRARNRRLPLVASLREEFRASPSQVGAFVLELWGLPGSVIDAIEALDHPKINRENSFDMKAALYIADYITSSKYPVDSFVVEDWSMDYLRSIDCTDRIPAWESFLLQATDKPTGSSHR